MKLNTMHILNSSWTFARSYIKAISNSKITEVPSPLKKKKRGILSFKVTLTANRADE